MRIVIDRHRGDDFLGIEENRERALDRDARFDALAGLVDTSDTLGQFWIERVGADEVTVVRHQWVM